MSRSALVLSPPIGAAAPRRPAARLSSDKPLEIVVRPAFTQHIPPRATAARLPLDANR